MTETIDQHHSLPATLTVLEPLGPSIAYRLIDSPVGELLALSDGSSLTGLYFDGAQHARRLEPAMREHDALFEDVVIQLGEYFAGARQHFALQLAPSGTAFQCAVWAGLREIPYGARVSYGELAGRIGRPKAVRALGQANGANPIAIIVPCHRVVNADKSLGGYGGGRERKEFLLSLEERISPVER